MALISGILKDAFGDPMGKHNIVFASLKNTFSVVNTVMTELVTGADGSYSQEVSQGRYAVHIYRDGIQRTLAGTIEVFLDSKNGTLNEFLINDIAESSLTPELIRQMIEIRNAAMDAAIDAKQSEVEARESAALALAVKNTLAFSSEAELKAFTPSTPHALGLDSSTGAYWTWNGSAWSLNSFQFEKANFNKGMIRPFSTAGARFGTASNSFENINSVTRRHMRDLFLNFKVYGARAGYFYRLAYFANNAAGGGLYDIQIEELAREGYATLNTAKRIHAGTVKFDLDGLVRSVVFDCTEVESSAGKITVMMQVDTKYLIDNPTLTYAAVLNTTSAYAWIIDENNYILAPTKEQLLSDIALTKDELKAYTDSSVNKKTVYPMISIGIKAGTLPTEEIDLDKTSSTFMLFDAIKDVKIINANPDYLYRISSWGLSDASNWLMQMEACSRENIQEVSGYINRTIHSFYFKPDFNVGIKRYRLPVRSDTFQGTNLAIEITIDTDAIPALVGRYPSLWRNDSNMYSYYFDPAKYDYAVDVSENIKTNRHSFGTIPEITSSTRLGIDPNDEMERLLNSGVNKREYFHGAIAKAISGEISWTLSSCVNTDYDRTENWNWATSQVYDLPILCIDSRVDNSPIDPCVFTPFRVNMSGWLFWTLAHDAPVRGTVKGSITAFFRVKDETTRMQVRLAFRDFYNANPNAETKSQTLGVADSGNSAEYYGDLNTNEFMYLVREMPDYTRADMIASWFAGKWVKKTIEVSQPIVFYPNNSYSLRMFIEPMGGAQLDASEFSSTDVIILSGGLSMAYNAGSRLSKLFNHRIDGGSTK